MAYLIAKYMFVYVYKPEFDSGAKFWPLVFNRIIAAILLGQLTLIGLFVFKKFIGGIIIFPLPILTLVFRAYIHKRFDPPCQYLPAIQYPGRGNGDVYKESFIDPVMDPKSYNITREMHLIDEGADELSSDHSADRV